MGDYIAWISFIVMSIVIILNIINFKLLLSTVTIWDDDIKPEIIDKMWVLSLVEVVLLLAFILLNIEKNI